jgi:hypothetical protein
MNAEGGAGLEVILLPNTLRTTCAFADVTEALESGAMAYRD